MVGTGALVAALLPPPTVDAETTPVELTAAQTSAPTPNPLLAAVVDRGAKNRTSVSGSWFGVPHETPAAVGALAAAVLAKGLGTGLLGWDALVNVGADVVADGAIGVSAGGVRLNTTVAAAFLNCLQALTKRGVIPVPLAAATADLVGGISTGLDIDMAGLGTALAWKAGLDGALADAVAHAGGDIVDALVGDFPKVDLSAAMAAAVGGVAAGITTALVWWDATVTLGASMVGGIALTTAITGADIVNAGAEALVETMNLIAGHDIPAITFGVELLSSAVDTGILELGTAIAWKAGLDAALAHTIATAGEGMVEKVAGLFPSVPDYPHLDLTTLRESLKQTFPEFPLYPPLELSDLGFPVFLHMLEQTFPEFHGFPTLPKFPGSGCTQGDLGAQVGLVNIKFGGFLHHKATEQGDSTAEQTGGLAAVRDHEEGLASSTPAGMKLSIAGKHALPGAQDETGLPTKHAVPETQDQGTSSKHAVSETQGQGTSSKHAVSEAQNGTASSPKHASSAKHAAPELQNEGASPPKHAQPAGTKAAVSASKAFSHNGSTNGRSGERASSK